MVYFSLQEEGYPYRRNGKHIHSTGTSENGERPHYIKTMRGGMQDVILLSGGGYTGSLDSPYANSVQPRNLDSDRLASLAFLLNIAWNTRVVLTPCHSKTAAS